MLSEALQHKLIHLAQPAITFGIALLLLLVIRHFLLAWICRRARQSSTFAKVFGDTVRAPSVFWALAAAISISLRYADLTERQIAKGDHWIVIFLITSFSLIVSSVFARMVALYGERQKMPFAVAGLTRTLTHVVVLSIGALVLLTELDISITPILTALGVTGLAVALALQDTLANFFAGIHILMEQPILVGDIIRLSTGEEGKVTDIGWRTTRVLAGTNNVIVIPNIKITASILTNFSMPGHRSVAEVPVIVGSTADPEKVSRVILEEAAATGGVLADPAPVVFFDPGVTPTHLQFKLLFSVAGYGEQGGVQSAVRIRIFERFQREGIPLPTVYTMTVRS